MSEKMDRQGVRTPADIERKYNLGQRSSAQGSSDKVYTLVQQFQQNMNTRLNELSALLLKEEQEKTIDITENGTTEVVPDDGKVLSKVTVNVDVAGGGAEEDFLSYVTNANQLFFQAKTFPSKAVVNLPNVTTVYQAFSYWNAEPIPIVEELTVNAPNIGVTYNQACMGQMFAFNSGVKKIVLNMPDESQYMAGTFLNTKALEEVVLNFSTKNIKEYTNSFNGSTVKRIIGILDFSSATNVNSTFLNCPDLEEVTFAPSTLSLSFYFGASSKLTAESVQSIIDGLATVETAQTLTLHKNIVLTDEQKATINAKGWTLAQ